MSSFELTPDEAYYWGWSRHLQGGYLDHPPMVAFLIALTTRIGGNNEIMIRLAAVLPLLGLFIIAYALGRDIFQSEKSGFYSVVWLNVILLFSLGSVVITPDSPLVFFCALTLYFLYHAIFGDKPVFWYCAGSSLGCALLSKYVGILLVPCTWLFLLFSHNHRHYLKHKEPYLALAVALAVFSPVIFWNLENDWISFQFQLQHGFNGKPVNPLLSSLEYLGTQILVVNPFVFAAIAVAMVYCYKFWVMEKNDRLLFLLASSVPVFLFFLLVSYKSKVEGNWPAIAYFPATLAMTGLYFTRGGFEKTSAVKSLNLVKRGAVFAGGALVILLHLQFAYDFMPRAIKTDRFSRVARGWELLGQHVAHFVHDPAMNPNGVFVFAERHALVSEIAFYLPGQPQTYRIEGMKRYSWLGDLSGLIGRDGIYVLDATQDDEDISRLEPYFDSVEELQPLPIELRGRIFRTFHMFRCKNYRGGLIEI